MIELTEILIDSLSFISYKINKSFGLGSKISGLFFGLGHESSSKKSAPLISPKC